MHDRLERFERLVSASLAIAALAVAGVVLHREFGAPAGAVAAVPTAPVRIPRPLWDEARRSGVLIGDTAAPVQVVVLADFECPFCKRFHAALADVRRQFGSRVAYSFVHFPLAMHRFARPAARAAECAGSQGRFGQVADLLYEKQDSLGLKSWASYASEAGVRDESAFVRCISADSIIARIDNGESLARKLGAVGTPTVLLNGWKYSAPPSQAELVRAIAAILADHLPYAEGK